MTIQPNGYVPLNTHQLLTAISLLHFSVPFDAVAQRIGCRSQDLRHDIEVISKHVNQRRSA
jgi:hypothetical protein